MAKNKVMQALTLGFDFEEGLMASCKGDLSSFGALMHAVFQYANPLKREEPSFEGDSVCSALWPMAKLKAEHSCYLYADAVRQRSIGGTITQLKTKMRKLSLPEDSIDAFFFEPEWIEYEENDAKPKDGWYSVLKAYKKRCELTEAEDSSTPPPAPPPPPASSIEERLRAKLIELHATEESIEAFFAGNQWKSGKEPSEGWNKYLSTYVDLWNRGIRI